MSSLRNILEQHASALVVDAASSRVQVGWITQANSHWATSTEEAGVGVFQCIAKLGVNPVDASVFLYCDGPGSILGIRTVAMALRSWCVLRAREIHAYCSLAIVAHQLNRPEVAVIADARRDSWHEYRMGGALRRLPSASLSGPVVMPEGFRHWSALPSGVSNVRYDLEELLPQVAGYDMFQRTEAPDAFLHEEPSYVTWTPRIHRASAPS